MQDNFTTPGVMTFPDYPFSLLPRQDPIIEQVFVRGSAGSNIPITGTADQDP